MSNDPRIPSPSPRGNPTPDPAPFQPGTPGDYRPGSLPVPGIVNVPLPAAPQQPRVPVSPAQRPATPQRRG